MPLLFPHVRSLPRPRSVVDFLFAAGRGLNLDACKAAVPDRLRRQKLTGSDVVADGGATRIRFSNYAKDRHAGFGGLGAVDPEIAWGKLATLSKGARRAQ